MSTEADLLRMIEEAAAEVAAWAETQISDSATGIEGRGGVWDFVVARFTVHGCGFGYDGAATRQPGIVVHLPRDLAEKAWMAYERSKAKR